MPHLVAACAALTVGFSPLHAAGVYDPPGSLRLAVQAAAQAEVRRAGCAWRAGRAGRVLHISRGTLVYCVLSKSFDVAY